MAGLYALPDSHGRHTENERREKQEDEIWYPDRTHRPYSTDKLIRCCSAACKRSCSSFPLLVILSCLGPILSTLHACPIHGF